MNRLAAVRLTVFAFAAATAYSQTNLIPNPTLAKHMAAPDMPDSWNQGQWGTNAAQFTYPVPGVSGGVAAKIEITDYPDADPDIGGDAKWYSNDVAVPSNGTCQYGDTYSSNVVSSLVIQFTAADGTLSYIQIAMLPSTNNAWATTMQPFTVPADAVTMTMFHLINGGLGMLSIANPSLVCSGGSDGGGGEFSTALAVLRFDDGWQSHKDNVLPILQQANMPGSFYIISNGMLNAKELLFPSANNPFNVTATAKKATWPNIYTDPTKHSFKFTVIYTASARVTLVGIYTPAGGAITTTTLGTAPAGSGTTASFSFTLPPFGPGKPITLALQVTTGTLTTSNPMLVQPIGYMDTNDTLAMQTAGNEIGDHTENHCNLGTIQTDPANTDSCALPPPSQTSASQEISGARTTLLSAGALNVDTLAYPYGGGANDQAVQGLVSGAGIKLGLSIDPGYNTPTTNPYHLLNQIIDASVTDFTTVQAWIDTAIANKTFLVLTFHQVELSQATITANNEIYGTTVAMLQNIVNYLATQRAAGKIVVDTAHNIAIHYLNR